MLIDRRDAPEAQPALAPFEHRLRSANAASVLRSVLENLRYGNEHARTMEADRGGCSCRGSADQSVGARLGRKDMNPTLAKAGDSLSTGENAQLVSFARAVLADPRIFVLDEATSSVDTVTERSHENQNAIERWDGGGADIVHLIARTGCRPSAAGGRHPRRPRSHRSDRGERDQQKLAN